MPVGVGIIGAGYAANLHAAAYRQLSSHEANLVGVASRSHESGNRLAAGYGIAASYTDHQELLRREDIQLVDICVPTNLHETMVVESLQAGKHVVVEKPLTGFFGDVSISRREASKEALGSVDRMLAAAKQSGKTIMYAENWINAPSLQKARRLIRASQGTVLDMRCQEAHSGSSAPGRRFWRVAGGGAALRPGTHAIAGGLYLKRQEGLDRGRQPVGVRSVMADMADLTTLPGYSSEAGNWMGASEGDSDTWATIVATFTDGTKATFFSTEHLLGGIQNDIEVLLTNARIRCKLVPSDMCQAFAPNPDVFADEDITDMLATKAGWSYPTPGWDWAQGYPQECRDFVEAVRDNRPPISDGDLGRAVVELIFAAYVSAEEGRRVELPVSPLAG